MRHVYIYLTPPPPQVGCNTVNFEAKYNGFEFSFPSKVVALLKPVQLLRFNHSWDGERIIGFILFPRVLMLCEMQTALSRALVIRSISLNNNCYPTSVGEMWLYQKRNPWQLLTWKKFTIGFIAAKNRLPLLSGDNDWGTWKFKKRLVYCLEMLSALKGLN